MQIEFHKNFIRNYNKRFRNNSDFKKKFSDRLDWFRANPLHPLLHDHPLKGEKSKFRSFSITGDIRVIYMIKDNTAVFIDIGTHNQVY